MQILNKFSKLISYHTSLSLNKRILKLLLLLLDVYIHYTFIILQLKQKVYISLESSFSMQQFVFKNKVNPQSL